MTLIRAKTPCCGANVRAPNSLVLGEQHARKCKVCGACYQVTVAPSEAMPDHAYTLVWRQTRKGDSERREAAVSGVKPTKRRGRR